MGVLHVPSVSKRGGSFNGIKTCDEHQTLESVFDASTGGIGE